MKILMVTRLFPPQFAGATVQAIYLSKQLVKDGMQPEFITNNRSGKTAVESYQGLVVYKIGTYFSQPALFKIRELVYCLKLFFFILQHPEYKVIFFHGANSFEIFLFFVCKLFNRKTILELTLVGDDDPLSLKKRKLGFLFYPCLKCVDKIIPISTQLRKLSVMAGIEESRLEVIPVGVDTSKFFLTEPGEKARLKKKLGYDQYSHVFLAVGQIDERKGYNFMVDAWKFLNGKLPAAVLLVAGPKNTESNPFYQFLQTKVKAEGIRNIQFLGLVDHVNELMRISDALLHCALREGLPNTLIEAGLSGLPIACRKMEGITSDIVVNPNIGVEVSSDAPQDFANAAAELIGRHNKAQAIADIVEFRKRFDIKEVSRRYVRLFEELTAKT